VAKNEEKQLESLTHAPALISTEVTNLLSEEEHPISFRDFSFNLGHPQPPSVPLSPSSAGAAATSFSGKDGGPGPGEGGGEGHGAARGRGNGDGSGSDLKAYGGGRGGHPGITGRGGSGDGSGIEGGNSRTSGGLRGRRFSPSGGNGAGQPRYAENPKPPYPLEARERGYQGEVLLKVQVLTNGKVGQIEVKRSSGHEILDQSALYTVKQWKFIPARKGEDTIPMWVNIPIKFQLQ
jgi:TonB family protein